MINRIKEAVKFIAFVIVVSVTLLPYFAGLCILDFILWIFTGRMYFFEFADRLIEKTANI